MHRKSAFMRVLIFSLFSVLFLTVSQAIAIVVSPTEINLVVEVAPGAQTGTYKYSIGVAPSDPSETKYTASADQGWMSVKPATGDIPGAFDLTITVSSDLLPNGGDVTGTVTVTSNTGSSATVTVNLTIKRIIADKLTVNPSEITLRFTRANLARKTFTAEVRNANYERNDFKWSAEVSASWLTVTPTSGEGATNVQVTVDPSALPAGSYCDTGDCEHPAGKITFRSNLPTSKPEDAEATLIVKLVIQAPNELTVFPSYLFWSVERKEDGTIDDFTSQILHVYAGATGFSISYNVPWIKITFLNPGVGENGNSLATSQAEGIFYVQPIKEVLQTYGVGRYEGIITVVDRGTAFYREVPIIVEIRNPGDPISLPVSQPTFTQMAPGFIMVEATDAHSLHMLLHVDDNLAVYQTQEACTAAGGTWLDPFRGEGSSGTGLPYCSASEKVYVLLSAPQKQPNKVYAYTPVITDKYLLVYQNGARVNETIDPYFSIGPIPEASFGPMTLAGLKGQMFISVRAGTDLNSTREMQEVQVNINTLEGSWIVSENYKGKTYTYGADRILKLAQNPDGMTYSGTWGPTPVTASIADGKTLLYKIEFMEGGIFYEYWVTSLSATEMKGKWRFSYKGDSSGWETFSAVRTTGIGIGNPFN